MIADPATATDNPGLYFKMEAKPNVFYQTAVAGWPGQLKTRTERMDIVIGSGVRGQSYLYWHGDQLYELPVSYWSDGSRWINSPGFQRRHDDFFPGRHPTLYGVPRDVHTSTHPGPA